MKAEHKEILDKMEEYLSRPGSENLRFWQAMRNCDLVVNAKSIDMFKSPPIQDDYNIGDNSLLERVKLALKK